MSTTSLYLQMVLQALDENPDTWGTVLNVSAVQLLEDGIAGTGNADVTSGDVTLTDTVGGPSNLGPSPTPSSRFMIIDITGTPGIARNVIVPNRSKIYVVANNTTGGFTMTVKTLAGTGIVIPDGVALWVYCDGTDVLAMDVENSSTSTLAATATNALSLGGVAAANYARLAVANTWTRGQVTQRILIADDLAGALTADIALSNTFFHEMTGGENLAAPLNPTNGAQFSLVVEQGTGAPHTLTFQAGTFIWASGVAPTLSAAVGNVDYLAFEYVTNAAIGSRWIGSMIKDVS